MLAAKRTDPIVTGTWVIVYKNQTDAAKATALARLLWFMTHDAPQVSASLNYAPVPKGDHRVLPAVDPLI